ncbi:MAG: bifunctional methylenetetrahydrofolate dehydrogenase/methenyltetrahydrofolate cyclohydrolase, partial [Candidatus Aminicenantes bacterium]|nr:bifunctional methylenetetrahydrofolate dehydrogenase/methenyltetrahydrofolate cyclohydrolase [Candidatus Aminicenantes bacterium]
MSAKIIDGEAVASRIREQVKAAVEEMAQKHGICPGLATVLVGDDPASQQYVRMKQNRCKKVGIESFGHILPAEASQEEVVSLVRHLGEDTKVHGILVQLPLPGHMDEEAVLNTIPLHKDVDGFHPVNIGR